MKSGKRTKEAFAAMVSASDRRPRGVTGAARDAILAAALVVPSRHLQSMLERYVPRQRVRVAGVFGCGGLVLEELNAEGAWVAVRVISDPGPDQARSTERPSGST